MQTLIQEEARTKLPAAHTELPACTVFLESYFNL